jgi:hypothetical protein
MTSSTSFIGNTGSRVQKFRPSKSREEQGRTKGGTREDRGRNKGGTREGRTREDQERIKGREAAYLLINPMTSSTSFNGNGQHGSKNFVFKIEGGTREEQGRNKGGTREEQGRIEGGTRED